MVFFLSMIKARDQISQEYEQVKEINDTLASFKSNTPRPSPSPFHNDHDEYSISSPYNYPRHEEPTRDPDVWPPPTPVDHRFVLSIVDDYILYMCYVKFKLDYVIFILLSNKIYLSNLCCDGSKIDLKFDLLLCNLIKIQLFIILSYEDLTVTHRGSHADDLYQQPLKSQVTRFRKWKALKVA